MTAADNAAPPMDLDSSMVGRVVGRRDVEIDFRSSALYAAAIGAERDIYLDDRWPDGAMAPPAFIASLEWPLVSGPDLLTAIGVATEDLFPRILHMYQDSAFAAPIRVGDRLTLEATLESIGETRSGALASVRIKTVNARSKTLVAESWFGGYFRDMKAPLPRTSRAPPPIAALAPEEPVNREAITISRSNSHIYDECARLRNPVHTDLSFATGLGLPDIALHGTLLWAKMGEIAIDRYHDGVPAGLRRLAARFRRPILPNRAMVVEFFLSGQRPGCASLRLRDSESSVILSEGLAQFDNRT